MKNPHILYWKWCGDDLCKEVMEHRCREIMELSNFDCIYVSLHSVPTEHRLLSDAKTADLVRRCAEIFESGGRRLLLDLDVIRERDYVNSNKLPVMSHIMRRKITLDKNGGFTADESEFTEVLSCVAVKYDEFGRFFDPCDIKKYSEIKDGKFIISAEAEYALADVICYVKKPAFGYLDSFDNAYFDSRKKLFDCVKDIRLFGAAVDEFCLGGEFKRELLIPESEFKIIDELDINKVNFYADAIPYSGRMADKFFERYGESLDPLYLFDTEAGNEAKSHLMLNRYFENLRKQSQYVEESFYDMTKSYFGSEAFVGAHNTWWGDELDNNFDKYSNGLVWWNTKRDYAQTDELIIIPIRMALARKCPKNIWYNMWYSMRTMDIKSYYKETYTNVIYGGRTHYLGYKCYEPGIVLSLDTPEYLNKISDMEKKVDELDRLQTSRPDSRVLVIFGYEAATNYRISDPGATRVERRSTVMHSTLSITKEIFKEYLCDLIPSSEIDEGYAKCKDGCFEYCGHGYDAVVMLYPDGITQKACNELLKFEDCGGNLIVCGNINVFHDGTDAAYALDGVKIRYSVASADSILSDLQVMKIKKNKGENYCVFEDGSITAANPDGSKNTGNGVASTVLDINEDNADIVFIDADGLTTVI